MNTRNLYDRFLAHTGDPVAAAILTLADRIEGSKPDSLTTEEAAEYLGCQPKTVREMCADGRLRSYRVGSGRGLIRITREELERYQSA